MKRIILLYRIIEAITVIRGGLILPIRQLFKHAWIRKMGIFNMKCCTMVDQSQQTGPPDQSEQSWLSERNDLERPIHVSYR